MKKLISCSGYASLIVLLVMVKAVSAETQEVNKDANQQKTETGTLTGVVLDKKTGGPVVAATVMVMMTQRGAATDLNGKFTLTNIPVGTHRVLVSQLGYMVHGEDVTFTKGQAIEVRFELEPSREGNRQEWGPGRATELSEEDKEYFIAVENLPEPIGGMAAIQANVVYPEIARRAGIQGTVYVEVFIDESGDVVKASVKKGIGAGCDESAVEAVKKTKFRPGTQRGKPVKVRLAVPIRFRLAEKGAAPHPVPSAAFPQKDYEDLFKFLGMRVGQFRYSAPREHELQISLDTYQHGKKTRTSPWISAAQLAGEHICSVVLWEEKDVVKLGLQLGKGGAKGEISFKIVGPLYHHAMLAQKMVEKEFIPVYVFASHPIIVPELDGTESIKEIVETYDQVLVVTALYLRR